MTAVVTIAAALKEGWLTDAARLRVGLLKRPQPRVPHMNLVQHPEYVLIVHELDGFLAWLQWFETPAKLRGLRPEWHRRVPAWGWTVQGEYEAKHPRPQPPPPEGPGPVGDNPPSRWKAAPWTKKHIHISHGLRSNDGVWTVDQLVQRCLTYGVRAVFAQLGDDCPDPDWAEHTRALYAAAKPHGIQVGGWDRADYVPWEQVKAAVRSVMPLDGYLADIEGPCSDPDLPEHLVVEFADEMPLGVIATGGIDQAFKGLSPQQAAARFGDWFDYVGQDYHKTDLPLTPDAGENFVYWRSTAKVAHGFRHLPDAGGRWHVPVVMPNAETCPPLAAHVEWLKPYAPHFGVWDAELIEAGGEWDVFASIGAT